MTKFFMCSRRENKKKIDYRILAFKLLEKKLEKHKKTIVKDLINQLKKENDGEKIGFLEKELEYFKSISKLELSKIAFLICNIHIKIDFTTEMKSKYAIDSVESEEESKKFFNLIWENESFRSKIMREIPELCKKQKKIQKSVEKQEKKNKVEKDQSKENNKIIKYNEQKNDKMKTNNKKKIIIKEREIKEIPAKKEKKIEQNIITRNEKINKVNDYNIHPSWEAKKQIREEMAIKPFKGKIILFE